MDDVKDYVVNNKLRSIGESSVAPGVMASYLMGIWTASASCLKCTLGSTEGNRTEKAQRRCQLGLLSDGPASVHHHPTQAHAA